MKRMFDREEVEKIAQIEIIKHIASPVLANNTWQTIANACKLGIARELWNVGDVKQIRMGGIILNVQLVDLTPGRYNYADGTHKSNAVFQFEKCLGVSYAMNPTDTNDGGYAASDMRNVLNTTIFEQLPADLKSVIADVVVKSGVGNATITGVSESENKLFLPTEYEVFGRKIYSIGESEGHPAFDYWKLHNTNQDRIKTKIISETAQNWWLRSPTSAQRTFFCFVRDDGSESNSLARNALGVCPCFAF